MSTPVQTLLAGLKASTLKLVGIIASTRHIPAGTEEAHNVLAKQAYTLVGEIVWEHKKGDYIPGILASCSKELLRVCSMTPRVWPNWHSIGHDDPQVSRHAWEALGDHSCDLSVVPDLSTGPLTIDLPSPAPVPPLHLNSSTQMSEFQDKGKGKARKSPMISGHSSQPPKSVMKSWKCTKSTRLIKLAPVVESEDEEDTIVQPILHGVPEVILPQLSTIVVRTPQVPRSPGSPKKQNFRPASKTAGSSLEVTKSSISHPEATPTSSSCPEVVEPTDDTAGALDREPPAIPTFDITIPGPNNPCHYCAKEDWHCQTRLDRRTGHSCLSCVQCSSKKIKYQPACVGTPPKCVRGKSITQWTRSKTPAPAPSSGLSASQSRTRTHSQSHGVSRTLAIPAATTPKVQSHGCSKTTARKTPAPAPATAAVLSSSVAVPHAALDVPMPDLHSMAIAIRDGAARITILEAHVQEQDGKIDTLQCLHESLQHQVVNRHPSFPLPDSPANATFLLDQSVPPPSMSPLPSTLPNLINLDMGVMEPTSLKVEDTSDMVGLMFEPSQVQPEDLQSSGEIVIPDDPGNLFPEYNSVSEEMDVEVKTGSSGEEVEMAT
ncbi:hypothetical protein EDD22DRAFT_871821 [Suillus occidentalis]|nr:hypothetical protein EDD22DRAFT_871821 [Suillus occidentalis]